MELHTHFAAAAAVAPAAADRSGPFRRFAVGDVVLVSPDGGRRHAQAGGGISGSGTVEGTVVERGPTYLHLVVSAWPAGVWG